MSNNRKIYTITELISDERFQNYCLQLNKADEDYWKSIILQNWNQREVFEKAYKAIHTLTNESLYRPKSQKGKVIKLKGNQKTSTFNLVTKWILSSASILVILFIIFNLSDKPKYLTISSSIGETKTVILPDSSKVVLNSNSMLVYEELMNDSREVQLVGEAFFEIKSKSNLSPFIVNTQHGNIRVTGTIFNVKSRSQLFESTLLEGGITFERGGKNNVILSPGDHLNISNNSLKITSEEIDSKIAWKDGRLFFKGASISEIVKRLKDDYNLTVIVENSKLKYEKFNANIVTSDPMVLLKSIAAIYEFNVVIENKEKVILK